MSETVAAAKMNGLGNAILVMDMRGRREKLAPAFIRALAQNPQSAFDQLMVLQSPPAEAGGGAAAKPGGAGAESLRPIAIYNADGSEAGACGNGARCLAEWLYRRGRGERRKDGAPGAVFLFAAKGGLVRAERRADGQISVDMGRPSFAPLAVPLALAPADMLHAPLALLLAGRGQAVNAAAFPPDAAVLSVGNPHAVFFIKDAAADLNRLPLAELGAALEHSPAFPQGVNVSLAQILSPRLLRLRVWERGAGLTKACGTAACAAQAAAHRRRLTHAAAEIILPGGRLAVRMEGGRCLMTGPAEFEYGGRVNLANAAFTRL